MERKKLIYNTKALAMIATLTAIGYGLSWLEFPIFPAAPFLKLDFSTFATLFGGYMFGPIGAIAIEGVKQLIIWGTKSSTAGVGEIANFLMTTAFVIVPSVLYRFKKGIPWVAVGMAVGCVLQMAASLVCNRYITFPLFMGEGAASTFAKLWPYVLGFNAIKSVAISLLVFFLYKKLSFLIKHYVLTPTPKTPSTPKIDTEPSTTPESSTTPATSTLSTPNATSEPQTTPPTTTQIDQTDQTPSTAPPEEE